VLGSVRKPVPPVPMTEGIATIMKNIGPTVKKILTLDYLFITNFDGKHHILMGIAPKQGVTFIIDSFQKTYPLEDFPARELKALALHICPDDKTWPIYGKWTAKKDMKDLDDSPPSVKQGDMRNCGVFTSTNMMCLAFGYALMCYRQRDCNISKRHRMAIELANDGFGPPPFDYQLLDVPTNIDGYRTNYG
jgi:hypothetical protein